MSNNTTFSLSESVSITEVDNELVLLDFQSGHYFGLNHVGADFIQFMQQGLNFALSSKKIAEKYQIAPTVVDSDLQELVQQLLTKELIKKT